MWVSAELRVKAGLNDMLLDGAINTFQVFCNFTVMGFFYSFLELYCFHQCLFLGLELGLAWEG